MVNCSGAFMEQKKNSYDKKLGSIFEKQCILYEKIANFCPL